MEGEKIIIYVLFMCILIAISVIDIKSRKIPNILCVLICLLEVAKLLTGECNIISGLKGAVVTGGIVVLFAVATNGGIGGGDIKLMASGGFFLGAGRMFAAILIGMGLAGIFGLIMIIAGRRNRKDALVLGPFLSVGMIVGLLYGEQLWNSL